MILYPKKYVNSVKDISYEFLKENNIHALVIDMDNTLIDFNLKILDGAKQWCDSLREKGIKILILSNSNKEEKLKKASSELNLEYISFAQKPLKKGFRKAIEKLQEKPENIASIGDQIFTDVFGANRAGIYSILVEPIDKKDLLVTRIKRPLENFIKNRYVKKEKK